MWIIKFKLDDKEHVIGSQDTEVEALRFVDGYIAAIVNHTDGDFSDEQVQSLRKDFSVNKIDDSPEET